MPVVIAGMSASITTKKKKIKKKKKQRLLRRYSQLRTIGQFFFLIVVLCHSFKSVFFRLNANIVTDMKLGQFSASTILLQFTAFLILRLIRRF